MEIEKSNWFKFFDSLFKESEKFDLEEISEYGNSYKIEFCSKVNQTQVEIILYQRKDLLLKINFYNPKTPGLNKYQETEYFFRDDFKDNGYGPSGLEFCEINKLVIEEFLLSGLKGKEIQYFTNSKIFKADLSFNKNKLFFDTTVYFENQGCLSVFFPKWSERNMKFDIVEIRYDDIFTLCPK